MTTSLRRRGHPFADPAAQRRRLDELGLRFSFRERLSAAGLWPLRATGLDTLQINVGRLCNQVCAHCHVDAGPDRKEVMPDEVVEACLQLLIDGGIGTLDVTGGAPELHPRFREIVVRASSAGRRVIHRCNLTAVLLPRFADIPALLAAHRVEVVASLPYHQPRETDRQRGEGVFEQSVRALRSLNALGYGRPGSGLILNLLTNPVGAFLPGSQEAMERDWKRELARAHGIVFDRLYVLTNMPIGRFLEFLVVSGNLDAYGERLAGAFNPVAAGAVMCRSLVSVGHDGTIYDCDFNQMLDLPVGASPGGASIVGADASALVGRLAKRAIRTGPHCFGCTAGAGSSCGGSVAPAPARVEPTAR